MALDWGERRVGIALSDAGRVIATPHSVLKRTRKIAEDIGKIAGMALENDVELIVVGMPFKMDGSCGPAAEKIMEVVKEMENSLDIPITTWDERLSTAEAEKALVGGDVSRARRKSMIDRVAAAIFLQAFLDSRSRGLA